jgi:nucleoside-diphosphate-sugar epimerase
MTERRHSSMRSLVTGGTGFIGRYLVDHLRERGDDVVVFVRRPATGAAQVVGDLTDPTLDLGAETFDVVYHVAGQAHVVPATPEEAERFYAVNARGTEHLLAALDRQDTLPEAVVLVSTVAVYGRDEGVLLDEDTPRAATDPYGDSKREAEDLVLDWGERRSVRIGIVRLPLVAGPEAPGNLGAMVRALARRRYLGIGDGTARRSMVWVEDVARILPVLAQRGGVYHLTDGTHPSFAELEAALADALGRRVPRHLPLAVARLGGRVGDVVQRVTGWRPPLTTRTVNKMTTTLTFSDTRARADLGWSPTPVLDLADRLVEPWC